MRSFLLLLILSTTTFGCDTKSSEPSTAGGTGGGTESASTKPEIVEHQRADDKATEDLQARRTEEAKLQSTFEAADRRLGPLGEKAAKLTGANMHDANTAIAVVNTSKTTVIASIAKMRDATLPQLDAAKAQVVSDTDAFGKSIDELEKITVR